MADNNYVENRDILKPSDLGEEVLVPIDIATRYNVGSWSELERKYLVAKNLFGISGQLTITPEVTAGSGSVNDFNIDYFIIGGKAFINLFCRSFLVAVGEATTTVTLDLTGTEIAPSSDFGSAFGFTGAANPSAYSSAGNSVQVCTVNTVSGSKKIQVSLTLDANASGNDYETGIGGSISITI